RPAGPPPRHGPSSRRPDRPAARRAAPQRPRPRIHSLRPSAGDANVTRVIRGTARRAAARGAAGPRDPAVRCGRRIGPAGPGPGEPPTVPEPGGGATGRTGEPPVGGG